MKKFYILSLCALIGASAVTAENRFKTRRAAKQKSVFKTEKTAPVWRAESATEFVYMEGEWIETGTTTYKYDSKGNAGAAA